MRSPHGPMKKRRHTHSATHAVSYDLTVGFYHCVTGGGCVFKFPEGLPIIRSRPLFEIQSTPTHGRQTDRLSDAKTGRKTGRQTGDKKKIKETASPTEIELMLDTFCESLSFTLSVSSCLMLY
mmetsp:Transcript_14538/g.29263  ORF Transcript_14538/g.29263 Transcript_14538/m.29263 type:complete len:123 (+) Transcript_14538:1066-1434(+)